VDREEIGLADVPAVDVVGGAWRCEEEGEEEMEVDGRGGRERRHGRRWPMVASLRTWTI
jgi:hypothetical protein